VGAGSGHFAGAVAPALGEGAGARPRKAIAPIAIPATSDAAEAMTGTNQTGRTPLRPTSPRSSLPLAAVTALLAASRSEAALIPDGVAGCGGVRPEVRRPGGKPGKLGAMSPRADGRVGASSNQTSASRAAGDGGRGAGVGSTKVRGEVRSAGEGPASASIGPDGGGRSGRWSLPLPDKELAAALAAAARSLAARPLGAGPLAAEAPLGAMGPLAAMGPPAAAGRLAAAGPLAEVAELGLPAAAAAADVAGEIVVATGLACSAKAARAASAAAAAAIASRVGAA
jgi:hypothetical protein